MEQIRYIWTDGSNKDFQRFYLSAEEYYSSLVGGVQNRLGFIPYNISDSIGTVLVAYIGDIAAESLLRDRRGNQARMGRA